MSRLLLEQRDHTQNKKIIFKHVWQMYCFQYFYVTTRKTFKQPKTFKICSKTVLAGLTTLCPKKVTP